MRRRRIAPRNCAPCTLHRACTRARAPDEAARIAVCSEEGSAGDDFEVAVAQLEEVMMDEGFNDLVGGFMKKHCGEFDEGEENKLV